MAEQAKISVIMELAHTGHKPSAIKNMSCKPNNTIYNMYRHWAEEGIVICNSQKLRSDKNELLVFWQNSTLSHCLSQHHAYHPDQEV